MENFVIRLKGRELEEQVKLFENDTVLTKLLDMIPDMILVLNKYRQVVFANKHLVDTLGIPNKKDIYGLRPGEAIDCKHSYEKEGRCGNAEVCNYCGALLTILDALKGLESQNECRIIQKDSGEALDLRVSGRLMQRDDEKYLIFSLADISDQKRREVLERVFFHDISNTAVGISTITHILKSELPSEYDDYTSLMDRSSSRLLNEIQAQKQLIAAEDGTLSLNLSSINAMDFLHELAAFASAYEFAKNSTISIDEKTPNINFISDKTILNRIMLNVIKNSLEAVYPAGKVFAGVKVNDTSIEFHVHNDSYISKDVQLQIFQRSFSTKGTGRGIGTYSIKLFTEKYLKGRVSFVSSETEGTTFYISIPLQMN